MDAEDVSGVQKILFELGKEDACRERGMVDPGPATSTEITEAVVVRVRSCGTGGLIFKAAISAIFLPSALKWANFSQ